MLQCCSDPNDPRVLVRLVRCSCNRTTRRPCTLTCQPNCRPHCTAPHTTPLAIPAYASAFTCATLGLHCGSGWHRLCKSSTIFHIKNSSIIRQKLWITSISCNKQVLVKDYIPAINNSIYFQQLFRFEKLWGAGVPKIDIIYSVLQ